MGFEVGVTVEFIAADSIYFIVNKNGTNAFYGRSCNLILAYSIYVLFNMGHSFRWFNIDR
jgi:hypothetical protein